MTVRKDFDHSEQRYLYIPVCDYCGSELPACNRFLDAVNSMRDEGWKRTTYRTETEKVKQDLCTDCQEEDEDIS